MGLIETIRGALPATEGIGGKTWEQWAEDVVDALREAEPDHFVTFADDGWFIEHSMGCRIDGTIGTCGYNHAVREIADDYAYEPDDWGRWWITDIDEEGLPSLERAPRLGGQGDDTDGE